jgi:hypothetical protein
LSDQPPAVVTATAKLAALKDWWDKEERREDEAAQTWLKSWILSLAVGNGAGLLTLGAALVNGWKLGVWLAIVPAIWSFAFGICAAGVAPLVHGAFHESLRRHREAWGDWIDRPEAREEARLEADSADKDSDITRKTVMGLVAIASASFVFGVFWPLSILTLWLFKAIPTPLNWP